MPTFLELAQSAAWESGTVSNRGEPSTVDERSGRAARFIGWVEREWTAIQRRHELWAFRQGDMQSVTAPLVAEQSAAAMGLARFTSWRLKDRDGRPLAYVGDRPLSVVTWDEMRAMQRRPEVGLPRMIAVAPNLRIVLHPTPDAMLPISLAYIKAPQVLTLATDIPEMPEEFHDVIMFGALVRMGRFDEAVSQVPEWRMEHRRIIGEMERLLLPPVRFGGPLA